MAVPVELQGRLTECQTLDRLLGGVHAGGSAVLVIRGEAGIGKSALLTYACERATGWRVAQAAGAESEVELAFAALHQLCLPMFDRLGRLPTPQRDAMSTAFGLSTGPPPNPFLVGLAALTLLSEVADTRPLLCVIDDAQWLDEASAQALSFVARRLVAELVVLIFAVRDSGDDQPFAGLPQLALRGLGEDDARVLLDSGIIGPLDPAVQDRIVAETRGNPLALLELPRSMTPTELAGGFGLPDAHALSGRIEQGFLQRAQTLPPKTRQLLLVAAADLVGEPMIIWRAADKLGIGYDDAAPAVAAGLIEFGSRIRFRHPLVRSAVYQAAEPYGRRSAHLALANATDPQVDPDRRAWHLAHAAAGPDEAVAEELERSAGRAQARGGLAAAAAFLNQAAALTPDPGRHARRALAAAQASYEAGAFHRALALLATAGAGPLDGLHRAHTDLLRAEITFASRRDSDAPGLLLAAARRLEPHDLRLARETYLQALSAASFAGRLAGDVGLAEVATAARAAAPPPGSPSRADLLLDGLTAVVADGYAKAMPALRRALQSFDDEKPDDPEPLRWLWLACVTALHAWDDQRWDDLSARYVNLARSSGALALLPLALNQRTVVLLFTGDLAQAGWLVAETRTVTEATGMRLTPYGALAHAAWQGREAEVSESIKTALQSATSRGEGIGLTVTHWANAVLCNGLGRYNDALASARFAGKNPAEGGGASKWALIELVEAGVRSGQTQPAREALAQLADMTDAAGDWGLGMQARSRALLSEGDAAEGAYQEALERLGRTRIHAMRARTHLVYGEWLRREDRRVAARQQLRTAYELLAQMDLRAYADRARRELEATGETVRRTPIKNLDTMTSQEAQVARLAYEGLTNRQIAGRLFLSRRTVEWHLHKVFSKLNIKSRRELANALRGMGSEQPYA